MEWISVSDRLPSDELERNDVWCVYANGKCGGFRVPNCYFDSIKNKFWIWADGVTEKKYVDWAIPTHWMPLPEPPKEAK